MSRVRRHDAENANVVRQVAQALGRVAPSAPPLDRAVTKIAAGVAVAMLLALFGREAHAHAVMRGAALSSIPDFGQAASDWLAHWLTQPVCPTSKH